MTYLPTLTMGAGFYLTVILDVFSRKILGFTVEATDNAEHAAKRVRRIALQEGVHAPSVKPVLHGDNGPTIKATTISQMLTWRGISPSHSRLRVSDDNPFAEAGRIIAANDGKPAGQAKSAAHGAPPVRISGATSHNHGHGKQHLAALLASLALLAFLAQTVLDLLDPRYQAGHRKLPLRRTFFEHLRALAQYLHFDSWANLQALGPAFSPRVRRVTAERLQIRNCCRTPVDAPTQPLMCHDTAFESASFAQVNAPDWSGNCERHGSSNDTNDRPCRYD